MWIKKLLKNKRNETRKPEAWTVKDVQHPFAPNSMKVPQDGRNEQNVVNWDIMQNFADQQGKLTT